MNDIWEELKSRWDIVLYFLLCHIILVYWVAQYKRKIIMKEMTKPVKGFEGIYEITNSGMVYNTKNRKRIKKPSICNSGYMSIGLSKNGYCKPVMVHLLVWDHFGDRPRDGRRLQVDHIDGDKLNNHIDNLQLLTNRENTVKGMPTWRSKYPVGVNVSGNGFQARIMVNGERKFLGQFKSPEEASIAYQKAVSELQ